MKIVAQTAHDRSRPLPTQLPQGEHTSGFVPYSYFNSICFGMCTIESIPFIAKIDHAR